MFIKSYYYKSYYYKMAPKKAVVKVSSEIPEIGESSKKTYRTKKIVHMIETKPIEVEKKEDELTKYFSKDELTYMKSIEYKKNGKTYLVDDLVINEYFLNIYPLKFSNNFREDFKNAMQKGVFSTSLFEDAKIKEEEEIKFLTTKIVGTKGLKCDKCKNFSTITRTVQTRKGDEEASLFIDCLFCYFTKKIR